MKTLILIIPCVLLVSCATVQLQPDALNRYVTDHAAVISKAVSVATSFAVKWAEKNPAEAAQLKADINRVVEKVERGLTVAAASADGTLKPDDLADALKVKDESVRAFFDGVVLLYRDGYEKLEASGKVTQSLAWANLILNSLKVLANGLNQATK